MKKSSDNSSGPPAKQRSLFYRVCRRCIHTSMEVFVIFVLLLVVAGAALFWHLSRGPLNIDFIRQNVETALSAELTPFRIEMEGVTLNWNNPFERPVVYIDDLSLLDEEGRRAFYIEEISATLARSGLIVGAVQPRKVRVKGLDLHLLRTEDNVLKIGFVTGPQISLGQGGGAEAELDSLSGVYEDLFGSLRDTTFTEKLKEFHISRAAAVYEDLQVDRAITFPQIDLTLRPGDRFLTLDSVVNFAPSVDGTEGGQAGLSARYDIQEKVLDNTLTFQKFNPFLWAAVMDDTALDVSASRVLLDGETAFRMAEDLRITQAEAGITASRGRLVFTELYAQPFALDEYILNASYDSANRFISFNENRLRAYGLDIVLDAILPLPRAGGETEIATLSIAAQNVPLPLTEPAYPDQFEHENIYQWLTEKLAAGQIDNLTIEFIISLLRDEEGALDADLADMRGDLDFTGLTAIYKDTLAPVEQATGRVTISYAEDLISVSAPTGVIRSMNASDIAVTLSGLFAPTPGQAEISFGLEGALPDLFSYLADEPIGLADEYTFDPTQTQGRLNAQVSVNMSTAADVPMEDIEIGVTGTGRDIVIPGLVQGLTVSTQEAAVTIEEGLITANGRGTLDGRATEFTWQQYMMSEGKPFKMKVEASGTSDTALRRHFGVEIDDYATGPAPLNVTYTSFRDGRAEMFGRADLTRSTLMFTPLDYVKAPGTAAQGSWRASFLNGQIQRIEKLNITGADIKIEDAALSFERGELHTGNFPRATIARSRASADFEFTSQNTLKLSVTGPQVDLMPFLKDDPAAPYEGPAIQASVQADQMFAHNDKVLSNGKIYTEMDRTGNITQFEIDALVGNGELYVRFKPDTEGRPSLRAEVTDAGAALRAFDVYENVQGGRLTIIGVPLREFWRGDLSGRMILERFAVRDAPILARLVNAMSLPGLQQLLSNDGIRFRRLEADFEWQSRPEGSLITVSDGRTSGSELGLTFDGFIDRASGRLDMAGTIVPASTVNNMIGRIPLIGDILTGGSGALIAATYTIRGPTREAEVSINPLSVLTPGILRRIFFENVPEG